MLPGLPVWAVQCVRRSRVLAHTVIASFGDSNTSNGTSDSVSSFPQTSIALALTLFWSDTNEKPYVCGCGDGFARRDLLKRHQRLAHEDVDPSSSSHGEVLPPQLDNGTPVNATPAESEIRDPFMLHQQQGCTLVAPLQEEGPAEIDANDQPEPSKSALKWIDDLRTDELWARYTPILQT